MQLFEVLRSRREITRYLDRKMPPEIVEQIVEAAYLSPTGNNLPSREFIIVTERETLSRLAGATPFVQWLKEVAAAIVITGLPDVSKYWLQDASIASGYIWLAAVDLGLGAAYGAIYHSQDAETSGVREQLVRNILDIPGDRRIVAIMGLGYPQNPPSKKEMYPQETVIYYGRFGQIRPSV